MNKMTLVSFITLAVTHSAFALETVGVKECDTFATKYETCVKSKIPAGQKSAMETSLNQMVASWKEMAKTDAGKKALATSCDQADKANKAAMEAYKCKW